ncbi:MAG TPA: DUF6221 family protein [Pseudonocardiaceae bacterium]
MDLAAFLLARLDTVAGIAQREAASPPVIGGVLATVFTPERVLAEVAAKRGIIALHTSASDGCTTCGEPWPCTTLRLVAGPYHAHPDFRPEWSLA